MNGKGDTRSGWVRAAVILQGVVFLVCVWSCLDLLFLWPKYAPRAEQALLQALMRATVEAAASGIAFTGLWRSKRWGWILAFLIDATMCVFSLSRLMQFSMLLRNPQWLIFSVWDFAAVAVLLHRPVRTFFLGEMELPQRVPSHGTGYAAKARAYPGLVPQSAAPKEINLPERCARLIWYFIAAVIVTCVVTAFSVMLLMGEKAGGPRGFLLFIWVGVAAGWGPSLLFALLLTFAMRKIGPGRLEGWLLAGLVLAPGLTLGMGGLASKTQASQKGILAYFFTGPLWLLQGWWLTIPAGLITAFLCFQMFPWGFGAPTGRARPLRTQD